jgi:membrane protein required for colicin V production
MYAVDYLLLLVIVASTVLGGVRGFLREVISVLTWLIGLIAAWQLGDILEPYLGGLLSGDNVRPWAARAIIFIIVLLIGSAVGAVVNYLVRLSIFSGTDRFLGGLFGMLRGVVFAGLFALLGQLFELDTERWWGKSLFIPYAVSVGHALETMTGEWVEVVKAEVRPGRK